MTAAEALTELRRLHAVYVRERGDRFAHCPFSASTAMPGWIYLPSENRVEADPTPAVVKGAAQ